MRSATRRWWRTATVALLGGAVIGGFAVGTEPTKPTPAKEEPALWSRAATPAASGVVPAGGVMPMAPDMPAAPAPLPLPKPVDTAPVVPTLPPPMTAEPPKAPPMLPPLPGVPSPSPLAPPAPPAKSVDPIQPVLPIGPDFSLRPGNGGNSVKPDAPAAPVLPPAPPPVLPPASPGVPAIPVDRSRPATDPLGGSDKFVFPVPVPRPSGTDTLKPDTTAITPGDRTMLASNSAALAAILGGALAFAPPTTPFVPSSVKVVDAGTADPVKDTRTPDEKIADLQKEVKRLAELLEGKRDSDGFKVEKTALLDRIRELENKASALQTQLDDMKKSTTALKPGAVPGSVVPAALRGTVRVVNEYPVEVSIVVNNTSYRVAPSKTLDVEVPAGDFSYQLLQNGAAPTRSTIKDKEVVTLRIK